MKIRSYAVIGQQKNPKITRYLGCLDRKLRKRKLRGHGVLSKISYIIWVSISIGIQPIFNSCCKNVIVYFDTIESTKNPATSRKNTQTIFCHDLPDSLKASFHFVEYKRMMKEGLCPPFLFQPLPTLQSFVCCLYLYLLATVTLQNIGQIGT